MIISQVLSSYPSCCGSFFMPFIVEDLSGKVPVFFIDGCSADSCDFDVPVRGGELRAFLLCRLLGWCFGPCVNQSLPLRRGGDSNFPGETGGSSLATGVAPEKWPAVSC